MSRSLRLALAATAALLSPACSQISSPLAPTPAVPVALCGAGPCTPARPADVTLTGAGSTICVRHEDLYPQWELQAPAGRLASAHATAYRDEAPGCEATLANAVPLYAHGPRLLSTGEERTTFLLTASLTNPDGRPCGRTLYRLELDGDVAAWVVADAGSRCAR